MDVSRAEFHGDAATECWLNEPLRPGVCCDLRPMGRTPGRDFSQGCLAESSAV